MLLSWRVLMFPLHKRGRECLAGSISPSSPPSSGFLTLPLGAVGQRIAPTAVPPAGLQWTLALPSQAAQPRTSGQGDRLCVRSVEGLETSLLVRPDGYLAAHGVPADPAAVLDHLAAYLPLQEAW
jgi:hypothetical protein